MGIEKVTHIFKNDLHSLVKNPAVMITIIVIIILPSLYALLNVEACWDPYGNTDNLDFAIVNNDINSTYNGKSLNFGDQVVDELKKNDDFDWKFVSEDNARLGVENGSYYAAIIIPENFTQDILSIDSQNPSKTSLTYLINEKTNPVASRMSNNVANEIQEKINYKVIQTVDSVAFKQLAQLGQATQQSPLVQLNMVNETGVDDYFYSPVDIDREEMFSVENYGSEVSPFYIVLSIWVGCVISVALIKTRYLGQSKYTPLELYFGRMGLFILIALLQSTVTLIGAFWLGIQIENPVLFIAFTYMITVVFIVLIYSFVSIFGNAGKAIAIVLLVFQISSTNGIYPVYVMNSFLQTISPVLPMTYAIDLLRNALLGMYWPNAMPDIYVLVGILMGILLISILIKELFDKAANKFEQSLIDSGLF
ncbi:MAG: YhgE/Pip domain-containing protein [Methanobrevibacter sp.]|uniref:YhgE/Pip domain-containing protein n=1 Tax=Methanobrevibacter sp. TaxID=66852 RepID=UPI0026E0189C|nr:YhgE/Pip domain-containing protein [Methanobrevibacter sp.]MDO5849256.1 YhgE/Pip domain-containing protein [Methanobrevibacter sp.]